MRVDPTSWSFTVAYKTQIELAFIVGLHIYKPLYHFAYDDIVGGAPPETPPADTAHKFGGGCCKFITNSGRG